MTKQERDSLFERLFEAEIRLIGAARYVKHLYGVTSEPGYFDAFCLIRESLAGIEAHRSKLKRGNK
jgi:hypothetical protein